MRNYCVTQRKLCALELKFISFRFLGAYCVISIRACYLSHVRMSVCPSSSAYISAAPTERISVTFNVEDFNKNLSTKSIFD
jgi:hypothetical protein